MSSVGQMFSNLFGGAASTAPQTIQTPAQMPQPGNLPEQMTAGMQSAPGNVNVPVNSQAAATPPAEGLDKFNDLWQPVESPAASTNNNGFNVDPKQLMAAAQKIDFSKVIQPAQLQAIAAGGPDAMAAFSQAMNSVAQTVYAQNAHATSKIVEQAINRSQETMRSELPQHIKRQNVSESLRADNPAFSHPAASPILGALEQQLTVKFPNATSNEISRMATDYLGSFATAMQKPQADKAAPANSGGTDWDAFLA